MTGEQIASLAPAMSAFLEPYAQAAFPTTRSAKHLSHYTLGLLSDLKRKSVEPIALASGVAVRTLQEFLSHMPWDHAAAQRLLVRQVAQHHATPLSVGVIDESGHAKQGTKTPGVQRQYCGETGKIDNCVVGVHLLYAAPGQRPDDSAIDNPLTCAVASDLYLPKSWADDLERRRQAGIPQELVFRTKWRIALDLLKDSVGQGLRFNFVTFDEAYGQVPEFWEELNAMGQWAVGEAPRNFHAWATPPKYHSLQGPFASKEVLNLAAHSPAFYGQQWREMHIKDTTRGRETWKVKHAMVQIPDAKTGRPSERKYHLIIAWRFHGEGKPEGVQGGSEVKYFLSNAPEGTGLRRAIRLDAWAASSPLFCSTHGGAAGVVRMAGPRLIGRSLTEEALLFLIRANMRAAQRGQKPESFALRNTRTSAVIGLAAWRWDPVWAGTVMVDVYCHPDHWGRAQELMEQLELPAKATRIIAYADMICTSKVEALRRAGFTTVQVLGKQASIDAARSQWIDVMMMEKKRG